MPRSRSPAIAPGSAPLADPAAVGPVEPPRAPKRMQMADIAALAGVSSSTVSRALSGHPGIPASTRDRIVEIARSRGYHVNLKAASLRTGRSQNVAVVISSADTSFTDPFTLSLISHLAATLDAHGLSLLLTRVRADQPERMAHMVENGEVSGLIVLDQSIAPEALSAMAARGIPIVGWGARAEGADLAYPLVGGDNERGGYLATRHLIAQGCRRIACLGQGDVPQMDWRHRGYVRALQEAGLRALPSLRIVTPHAPEGIAQQFSQWLAKGHAFDGVFCFSDVAAIRAIAILSAQGTAVPAQVKVVGYDDIEMAAHLHPSISSVRQPVEQAAQAMVEQLFALQAGQVPQPQLLPTELQVRESSA